MKILLVEDDKFLSNILEKKLKSEGFDVVIANDGNEALEKVLTERPDMMLLDIILPHKSGFLVLEQIKKDPEFKNMPVLIISNLAQPEDVQKGLELGAIEYFVKARFSIDDLIRKVKEHASKQ